MTPTYSADRRKLLGFLAASPLLCLSGGNAWALQKILNGAGVDLPALHDMFNGLPDGDEGLARLEEMLNIMDFEDVARKTLPPAHFGYLATGVDDDATVRANREGYGLYEIRSRRLVDIRTIDTSVRLFGTEWSSPIFLDPVGSQKAFHPDGEIAAARAAKERGHLQILSTVASSSVEDVTKARGGPIWQQLYPTDDWKITRTIISRAQNAGCPVLVLTVDLQDGSNRETLYRSKRNDPRDCGVCHETGFQGMIRRKPTFEGLDLSNTHSLHPPELSWEYLKRLRDITPMKLLLKGILTREDAQMALDHGVDGIVVSNHGGRAEETNRSTIECLPEVAAQIGGRIPVLFDGGIRRGTDVLKALALGATAVGIGRPYIWGLAGFGQPGVVKVLDLLRHELSTIMKQVGLTSIRQIPPSTVVLRPR